MWYVFVIVGDRAGFDSAASSHTNSCADIMVLAVFVETPEDEADNRDYAGDEGEDEEGVQ